METASNNEIQETTNFLYRIKNILEGDFSHIEHLLSDEFKTALFNECEKFIDEENKRGI